MTGTYLTWLAQVLRAAGLNVVEQAGWETRARKSGGYGPDAPVCVMWHHTASKTSPSQDAHYMCHVSADRPIANLLVVRDGAVWVLAAGCCNTNGTGGPVTIPPGVSVLKDTMNVWAVGMEIANDGIGEPYPAAQIDAAFTASAAVCKYAGLPTDAVCTHQVWAPTRKIDPARAEAVKGRWQPRSVNSSGTWSLDDLRAELRRRATPEVEMARILVRNGNHPDDPGDTAWHYWVVWEGGKYWLPTGEAVSIATSELGDPVDVGDDWMVARGPVVGENPTDNPYGVWSG